MNTDMIIAIAVSFSTISVAMAVSIPFSAG
jgi:hypothetical protein